MNKRLKTLVGIGVQTILFTGIVLNSYAQKLDNIQEGGVWAPEGIKVDGRVTEWTNMKGFGKVSGSIGQLNDAFRALNKTVNLYYTMANDGQNLYLVVKSGIAQTNAKMMAGGVTLAVNTAGKKNDKQAFRVTFPMINGGKGGRPPGGFGNRRPGQRPDSAQIADQRKQQLAQMKDLSVLGFKEITDTLISVYNEFGIKAAASFDDKGLLMYEMSIPLKLMSIQPEDAKEFAYHITVNGIPETPQGGFGGGRGGRGGRGGGRGFDPMNDMQSPTDFWGKYLLAKKE